MGDGKQPEASPAKKAAALSWSTILAVLFILGALVVMGSTKATGTSVNGLIQKVSRSLSTVGGVPSNAGASPAASPR